MAFDFTLTSYTQSIYPCDVLIVATPTGIPDDAYLSMNYTIGDESAVTDVINNEKSVYLTFRLIRDYNFDITCTGVVYRYNLLGQQEIIESVTHVIQLYVDTATVPYMFDVRPSPAAYDLTHVVNISLEKTPLTVSLWTSTSLTLETPHYIPVRCDVSGGAPDYVYEWFLDCGEGIDSEDRMYARGNIASVVFPEQNISYEIWCRVTDGVGEVVESEHLTIASVPSTTSSSFLFDDHRYVPINYDESYTVASAATETTYTQLDKRAGRTSDNMFYVGTFKTKADMDPDVFELWKSDILALNIQNTVPDILWTLYESSNCSGAESVMSRKTIAQPNTVVVHSIDLDDDGYITFLVRVLSIYPLPSAICRLRRIINLISYKYSVTLEDEDYWREVSTEPTIYEDDVVSDLLNYLETLAVSKYSNIESENLFEAIGSDVDDFLSSQNKYYRELQSIRIGTH